MVQVDGDEPCEALTLCGDVFVVNPPQQKFECTGLHISLFGSGGPSAWQELRMIIRIVHGPRDVREPLAVPEVHWDYCFHRDADGDHYAVRVGWKRQGDKDDSRRMWWGP